MGVDQEKQAWIDIAMEINYRMVFKDRGSDNPITADRAREIYKGYEDGRGIWFLGLKNVSADDDEVEAIKRPHRI